MNKKALILTVGLTLIILAGCSDTSQPLDQNSIAPSPATSVQKETEETSSPATSLQEKAEATSSIENTSMEATSVREKATYEDYTKERYLSLKGKEPLVLFFHASWCPTCKRMEKDIQAQLDTFPAGTKILKTDYDTENELKKEYGINVQSIIVIVDKNGNVTYKKPDPAISDLKLEIAKSLTL